MSEMMDSATQTYDDPDPDFGPGRGGSPRVEIDTSAPFGSVEEAVIRFGGRGFWAPRVILHSPPSDNADEFDMRKLEEQAAEMLKDLDTKQRETLAILKELEQTKRLIEELKLKLHKETSEQSSIVVPPSNIDKPKNNPPSSPTALVMMELKQAKRNLSQSTNDLEAIRASVECVNKKVVKKNIHSTKTVSDRADELSIKQNNNNNNNIYPVYPAHEHGTRVNVLQEGNEQEIGISRELRELNFEAEQFMNTAEAAKSEVLRAMCDIENTKAGLKMIEMRWVAAKKLEEAAKATEALALAEIKALSLSSSNNRECAPPPPPPPPTSLAEKARKAEDKPTEMSLKEFMSRVEAANRRARYTSQQPSFNDNAPRFECLQRRGGPTMLHDAGEPRHGSTSIGDILSRKLVLRDDLDVGRRNERQRVSLDQMLHRQRTQTSPPPPLPPTKGGGGFFSKRKNLGFVHISKQSKNRIQALNLW